MLAKVLNCSFLDADDFHPLSNKEKMSQGIPLSDEDRIPWLETLQGVLKDKLDNGKTVILGCSSLQKHYREILRSADADYVHGSYASRVQFVLLDAKADVLAARLEKRAAEGKHFMPATLLQSQLESLNIDEVNNSKSAMADQTNGVTLNENQRVHNEETLYDVLHRSVSMILPDASSTESAPLLQRIKISVSENGPRLGEASRNTGQTLLRWTRRGSPLRALLVISIGSVAFLALTGLLIFMLIFLVATVNAIIVSLLISLAAAGGFLFFSLACVTAIYIGAMSIAAFVISIATISAIFAAMITAGWVGFFWAIWLGTRKSVGFAKQSLSKTGSVLSAYSSAEHARID
ncbi:hypothetical protein GOBAR_AA33941 [Gossypium barbadense]|uniref:Gluconokinase n=5 Tax=Gossypium TaxID=3633 RepID=A0A2P5W6L4_GOSBA|nr:hypothetical protein GOBAR_AA33941 [Gossypium barbadense]